MKKYINFINSLSTKLPLEFHGLDSFYFLNCIANIFLIIIFGILGILSISLLPFVLIANIIYFIFKIIIYIKYKNKMNNTGSVITTALNKLSIELLKKDEHYTLKNILTNDYLIINRETSLEEFIFDFVRTYNFYYFTIGSPRRYVVCEGGKRRSLGDIFLISKEHYPNCTIEEVLKILIKLYDIGNINGSYCTNICKYVFYHTCQSRYRDADCQVEYESDLKFSDYINYYNNKK